MQKMHVNRNLLEHLAGFARQAKSFACSRGGSGWKLQAQSALVAMDAIRTALETQHTNIMKIKIQLQHPNAKTPTYGTEGAGCFDLYAATVNGAASIGDVVYPGHPVLCDTGVAFEVPDGYMLQVRSRSGLAFKHGIEAFHGTIDSDYRGTVQVLLTCAHLDDDEPPVKINPCDRIAQACLVAVPRVEFETVEQLSFSDRASSGFGSTGA